MNNDTRPLQPARTIIVEIPETRSLTGKPLAEPMVDAIIECRLRGMNDKATADALNVDRKSVALHWKRYLQARSAERLDDTTAAFAELIERLNQNAMDSRAAYYQTIEEKPGTAQKFLVTERQALDSLARIGVERDDAPMMQARMQAATATVFASVVREVVAQAALTNEQRSSLITAFALAMRGIDTTPPPMIIQAFPVDDEVEA